AAAAALAVRDLVDLVDEHNAAQLDTLDGLAHDALHIQRAVGLVGQQQALGLADADLLLLGALVAAHAVKDILQVHAHLFKSLTGEDLHHLLSAPHRGDSDRLAVQFLTAQLLAQALADALEL